MKPQSPPPARTPPPLCDCANCEQTRKSGGYMVCLKSGNGSGGWPRAMNQPAVVMTSMAIQRRLAMLLDEHKAASASGDSFSATVCYGGIYALSQLAADLEITGASIAAADALMKCTIPPRSAA